MSEIFPTLNTFFLWLKSKNRNGKRLPSLNFSISQHLPNLFDPRQLIIIVVKPLGDNLELLLFKIINNSRK